MAQALDKAVRQARRKSRTPPDAKCADCGIAAPVLLHLDEETWRCYECAKMRRGERPDEAHHLLGKDMHPMTVEIPANVHRFLSEAQRDLPEEIRGRSPHNPLVGVIRILAGLRGMCQAFLDFLTASINWLARLLARLEAYFGANWATALELPPLFG